MKRSRGEKVFGVFNGLFMVFIAIIMLFPMLVVLKQSLDLGAAGELRINLIPAEPTVAFYQMVFMDGGIYRPLVNSIVLVLVGTSLSMLVNAMGAYTMAQKKLKGREFFVYFLVIVPMVFGGGGGLIVNFIYYKAIGLLNRFMVLFVPVLAEGWYMILIRNYFRALPDSLAESARIDGAGEFLIFQRIMVPLAKPVLAAITLFAGVRFWNEWFSALFFINDWRKYTFPLKLRGMILVGSEEEIQAEVLAEQLGIDVADLFVVYEGISSAMIIIAIIPILLVYPYLQRYFAQGLIIGSVKG